MAEKILMSKQIVISRRESNFDKACDEAYTMAVSMLGIDDCGHSDCVEDWDRSSCYIRVVFEKYNHIGSMVGHEHKYIFRGEAVGENGDDL
ncbi:hypothetical protein C4577_02275 [Candidatus Parcubacteria bacterium]|nr:MAG: hypothetical protein C4577_02275 [Candidatus Parcubacteria bacterium]